MAQALAQPQNVGACCGAMLDVGYFPPNTLPPVE
jgi:hypothetical protein